jgi:hypothetical protein
MPLHWGICWQSPAMHHGRIYRDASPAGFCLASMEWWQSRVPRRPAAISEKCLSSGVPDLGHDNLAQQFDHAAQ